MKIHRILILVGQDRPGIVDEVSTLLYDAGANIEDSRMAVLGGCFSIMALFSCTPDRLEGIQTDLQQLEEKGFQTLLHQAADPMIQRGDPALPLRLEIQSMDHPGIVQKIVRLLHDHEVNIVSLDTQISHAPVSGTPLFDLTLAAEVPAAKSIAGIKSALAGLAEELDLNLLYHR
ncbi:MAG: glycine cleavage system protein R [Thermodesulfobacteriota bacterium]